MMNENLIKAIIKTLFIWVKMAVFSIISGGVIICLVAFFTNLIVDYNLGLFVLLVALGSIIYMFCIHVKHIYKNMLQ